MKKPLSHRSAILLSIAALWLGSVIGIWLLHLTHQWYLSPRIGQVSQWVSFWEINSYYMARVGAQLPALALVVLIIDASDFQNPCRTGLFIAFGYHSVMTSVRLIRWPWSVLPDINPIIPISAELAQLLLLVLAIGLIYWLLVSLRKLRLDRYFSR